MSLKVGDRVRIHNIEYGRTFRENEEGMIIDVKKSTSSLWPYVVRLDAFPYEETTWSSKELELLNGA